MVEHVDIADPNIHEPKDIGAALVEQVYVADGLGGGAWKPVPPPETLFQQIADQTVANTVTETTLFAAGIGTLTLATSAAAVGASFRIRIQGRMSSTGSPTLELKIKVGGVTIVTTTPSTLGTAITDEHYLLDFIGVIRSLGVTGTLMGTGGFLTEKNEHFGLIILAPVIVDTTVDQLVDVTATWGTAAAANTITAQTACIEIS